MTAGRCDRAHRVISSSVVTPGVRAFAAAETARRLGVDLIVTDHHRGQDGTPTTLAVLNPNQPGCDCSLQVCAALVLPSNWRL